MEAYHTPLVHPELTQVVGDWNMQHDVFDDHVTRDLCALAVASPAAKKKISEQERIDRDYAAFGEVSFDITDKLTLTGGGRVYKFDNSLVGFFGYSAGFSSRTGEAACPGGDHTTAPDFNGAPCKVFDKTTKEDGVTPRLNVTYKITPDAMVYANYSQGYKAGGFNIDRSGFLIQPNTTSASQLNTGQLAFAPEFTDAYELGLKSEWFDRRLTVNANVFYYDYKDIQVNLLTVNSGVLTTALTNGAKGKVKGAELEIEGQPTDNLHLRAAVSFLDTEYTDFKNTNPTTGAVTADYSGNSFVRSPRNVVSLGADYTIPLEIGGKLVAGGDVSFRDKEYFLANRQSSAEPTLSQPHYTLANSRLTWFSPDEKLSVTGFVNNLTDRRYQVHGRPNGPQGQYVLTYGDPRTVGVSVTSRF